MKNAYFQDFRVQNMIRNLIMIDVCNKPYKKMDGYLRSLKFNPERIAIAINEDNSTFCPIKWGDILLYGHRIKKIILLKRGNLLLYVGSTSDDKTIVYNEAFSEYILLNSVLINEKDINKTTKINILSDLTGVIQKSNIEKINAFLDNIKNNGLENLTFDERKELDNLLKFIK